MSETTTATPLLIRLFGPFQIQTPGQTPKIRTKKTKALAALLALNPGTQFSREQLAADLWPEATPASARQSLRMALANLRSILGPNAILSPQDKVALDPEKVTSDVAEFEKLRASGQSAQALDLVQGPLASDLDHPWLTAESYRLHEAVAQTALVLAEKPSNAQERQSAIARLKSILTITGCREDLHIALMRLYIAEGIPSLAIAQFEILERDLADLWGEPPSARAYEIIQNAPRSHPAAQPAAVPLEPTGLFGRNDLYQTILSHLNRKNTPLVTLTGPGGSGKTALAIAVYKHETSEGRPTAFFDLTPVTDLKSALAKILGDLGLPGVDPPEALPVLTKHLKENPALYILDNLEQLGPDAATLVESLQSAAPATRLLVTSRTPLNTPQEVRIPVLPLALPAPRATLSEIRRTPAVRLFEHHARIANPAYQTTADNAAAVAELCRRLDGLPLAIIIAASRTVVRSPAQIIADLQADLRPFKPAPGLPERHQSLHAAVRWSLRLLEPSDQRPAQILAVFQGRFTAADAASILQVADPQPHLARLVEASLLNSDPTEKEARFWFFETVRTSLVQILTEDGLAAHAYNRLLDHCLHVVRLRQNDPSLPPWQKIRLHLAESENILQALRAASTVDPRAVELAILVQTAFSAYGKSPELAPILRAAYEDPTGTLPDALRARAGATWVTATSNQADVQDALAVLNRCFELAQGDEQAEFIVRSKRTNHYKTVQAYDLARQDLDWLIDHADPEDHDFHAWAWHSQGLVACCVNQRKESLEHHKKAAHHARQGQDIPLQIRILYDVGAELAYHGQNEDAVGRFQLAIALAHQLGSAKLEGLTLWQYADALLSMGRPQDALEKIKQAVDLVYEANYDLAQKWIFLKAGEAALKCGHAEAALRLLAKGVHVRETENRPLADYEQTDLETLLLDLKQTFQPETFHRLWHEGTLQDWQIHWDSYQGLVSIPDL